MKKIKIPFSLEEYNKGEYEVENGFGYKVRILYTDAKYTKQPIVGLVSVYNGYCEDGSYCNKDLPCSDDLVLVKYEFEDGDIVTIDDSPINKPCIGIFKRFRDNKNATFEMYAVVYYCDGVERISFKMWDYARGIRHATNEETQSLYSALATQKGLRWNAEIKDFEKIEKKIELKPKDFVLVRDGKNNIWELDTFGRKIGESDYCYKCISGRYMYCIPFNSETEHLLGKTEACPEKYQQNK